MIEQSTKWASEFNDSMLSIYESMGVGCTYSYDPFYDDVNRL